MFLKSLTKGDTLIFLSKYQQKLNFVIPKTYVFKFNEHKLKKKTISNNIIKKFKKKKLLLDLQL